MNNNNIVITNPHPKTPAPKPPRIIPKNKICCKCFCNCSQNKES